MAIGDEGEVVVSEEELAGLADSLGFEKPDEGGGEDDEAKQAQAAADAEKAEQEAAAKVEADATKAGETGKKEDEQQVAPPAKPDRPKSWKKEAIAEWDKLPETVRAEVMRREEDFFKGIEQYKEGAGVARAFYDAIKPFEQSLRQYNLNPIEHTRNLMAAHQALALGSPEQKVQMFRRLASDYGVKLESLGAPAGEAPHIDPQVAALQTQLAGVKSSLAQNEERYRASVQEKVRSEVEAFASAPGHEHFDAVAEDITRLISSGTCSTLQQAYDQAIWMNPTVRQSLVDKANADALAKANAERAAKAAQTRSATAANVRTTPKSKGPTAPVGSMDETLNRVAEKLFAGE